MSGSRRKYFSLNRKGRAGCPPFPFPVSHHSSLDELDLQDAWLTIGVFDGVHRGHQEILRQLTSGAHKSGNQAVVLTFSPHPAIVLGGKTDFKCLTTTAERIELLDSYGVDVVISQPFTRTLADQTAEAFMQQVSRSLGLRNLLIGYDTALGRGREGNAARLMEIGRALNYSVQVIPPVTDQLGIISSTRIRSAVFSGKVKEAADLLGYPYFVTGPVIHGDGRGHTINVPTANIQVPEGKAIPANGIYACWAWVDGKRIPAATNVGVRPTFTPDLPAPMVEAHLLDFNRNLYGKQVKLEFINYLRPEEKYSSVDELIVQIQKDIAQTRINLAEGKVG
jgi:riboflavin kinase / FMN adenylyltransferase